MRATRLRPLPHGAREGGEVLGRVPAHAHRQQAADGAHRSGGRRPQRPAPAEPPQLEADQGPALQRRSRPLRRPGQWAHHIDGSWEPPVEAEWI